MDLYTIRKELSLGTPLFSLPLKVVSYARVSTEHEEQKKSLKNQVEHFEEYIKSNKNWMYVTSYIDEGISGTSDKKREEFLRMIEDAKEGKFDLIITKEISRFSRNTLDSIKYTRELLSYGVFVYFVNDNINTALPDSELRLTIMASMAQDEVRRLSERVKFGMNRAILKGELLGNNLLYGYRKDKEKGNLSIVLKEADVVRRIYHMYAIDFYSLSKISKILKQEGKKTSFGNDFSVSTLSRMIRNPKYKGYYCGRKTEVIDYMSKKVKYLKKEDWVTFLDPKIPVIIEEELWNKANERLEARAKKERGSNRYLYSGKIYCKKDHFVYYRRYFRRGKKDVSWVCSNYLENGKKSCSSPKIREEELNQILFSYLSYLSLDFDKVERKLLSHYKVEKSETIKEEALKKKQERLLELFLDNVITKEEYCFKKEELEKKIKKSKEPKKEEKNRVELQKEIRGKLESKKASFFLLSHLLDHILVSYDNNKIVLDIFLFYKKKITKEYTFQRGYDTKGTKRYSICYLVHFLPKEKV